MRWIILVVVVTVLAGCGGLPVGRPPAVPTMDPVTAAQDAALAPARNALAQSCGVTTQQVDQWALGAVGSLNKAGIDLAYAGREVFTPAFYRSVLQVRTDQHVTCPYAFAVGVAEYSPGGPYGPR